jgi:hypothetical protein
MLFTSLLLLFFFFFYFFLVSFEIQLMKIKEFLLFSRCSTRFLLLVFTIESIYNSFFVVILIWFDVYDQSLLVETIIEL